MEPGGWRRPGLYADIPVPVLQVPAREEGGPGGLPHLLKDEEMEEDEEEKKGDDDGEEIEGKRREEEDMQGSLVVEEGIIVTFPLVPFATCLLPLQFLLLGPFQQEEVNNHIYYTMTQYYE